MFCAPRLTAWLTLALLLPASNAAAANLDISTEYRMRALSYTNLNLDPNTPNNRSLLTQRARLGVLLKEIQLGDTASDKATMDVGIKLQALGAAGSTTPFQSPFNVSANNYPNTQFVPFIENAFVETHNLWGGRWDLKIGRQSYRLGSGLLLDDDGAGFTGVSARARLPWWDLRAEGFLFEIQNQQAAASNLDVFGFTLELPTDGVWQLNELVEKDRTPQNAMVDACGGGGCPISKALRSFTDAHYQLSYGPLVFEGEAAIEKGVATPTGPNPLRNHITYNGNAEVMRVKWKQTFWRDIRGIARISAAHGSGDDPRTPSTDEAFRPSHGHRFDGLEYSGFGEFFAATPYSAFGGRSSSTASGLPANVSGITCVALGVTPPAWRGIAMDLDYYLYQADRNKTGPDRNLGREFDLRLRYDIGERFSLRASAAFFKSGLALDPSRSSARRFAFEAQGRF